MELDYWALKGRARPEHSNQVPKCMELLKLLKSSGLHEEQKLQLSCPVSLCILELAINWFIHSICILEPQFNKWDTILDSIGALNEDLSATLEPQPLGSHYL